MSRQGKKKRNTTSVGNRGGARSQTRSNTSMSQGGQNFLARELGPTVKKMGGCSAAMKAEAQLLLDPYAASDEDIMKGHIQNKYIYFGSSVNTAGNTHSGSGWGVPFRYRRDIRVVAGGGAAAGFGKAQMVINPGSIGSNSSSSMKSALISDQSNGSTFLTGTSGTGIVATKILPTLAPFGNSSAYETNFVLRGLTIRYKFNAEAVLNRAGRIYVGVVPTINPLITAGTSVAIEESPWMAGYDAASLTEGKDFTFVYKPPQISAGVSGATAQYVSSASYGIIVVYGEALGDAAWLDFEISLCGFYWGMDVIPTCVIRDNTHNIECAHACISEAYGPAGSIETHDRARAKRAVFAAADRTALASTPGWGIQGVLDFADRHKKAIGGIMSAVGLL